MIFFYFLSFLCTPYSNALQILSHSQFISERRTTLISSYIVCDESVVGHLNTCSYANMSVHVCFKTISGLFAYVHLSVRACVGNSPLLSKQSWEAITDVGFEEMKHCRGNLSGSLKCHLFHCSLPF